MKNVLIAIVAFAITLNVAQAQEGKMKRKADANAARATVAVDKADMKMNKEARQADKMSGDKEALKADRKAGMKKEGKLLKDQVKKDVKVVKSKV